MFEQLNYILAKISIAHLNILFLLGLALFGGTAGGRIFQRLKIPQVVGYIAIGIIIGESGLRMVNQNIITTMQPFNYFALGLIGFMVGGELKKDILLKYGRQFITILLCEGISPFIFVSLLVGGIGSLFFDTKLAWSLALLFGAIASATDPATTTEVCREYKTKGPLTTTIMGIVALDDGLALMLFAVASSVAGALSGHMHGGFLKTFVHPLYDIGGAIILGTVSGFALSRIFRRYSEKERLLAFTVGTVLLVTGLSLAINVEMLLAVMTVGIVVVNLTPQKSKEVFKLMGGFTPPIYVLFFVLIGARLNLRHMTLVTVLLVGIYLFGTFIGKIVGSRFGARISGAPQSVQRYLPLGLFSQAGVAIGLSILAAQYFPGEIGNTIIVVITATTVISQLIGPPFTKFALTKAGEAGLNITEEDIIQKSTAKELMDKNPPLIYESMELKDILRIFSDNDNLYYPVINKAGQLRGIVTVEGIKQSFLQMDISGLILAHDLMEPVIAKATVEAPISEVNELLDRYNIEYLPIVGQDDKLEGFIERKKLNKFISTKIIELHKQADSLGEIRHSYSG
ncbi:cation:proton antiporter [bacterium]|nr:cation:proton antiporter [bacterium]